MRIIHIASFKGNCGDIINHHGFYTLLSDLFEEKDVDKIEIRDFYFSASNKRNFDYEFAMFVNQYDLCILGGGGFFDCRWEKSATGVTMDINDDFISTVSIPVIVNAMGYHEFPAATNKKTIEAFHRFLQKIIKKNNWFVTIRNDGSIERLAKRYGKIVNSYFLKVPDNAFANSKKTFCDKESKMVGLCIMSDMFTKEFSGEEFSVDKMLTQLAIYVEENVGNGYGFTLFAHTPQDLQTINLLLYKLDKKTIRNCICVAPVDYISEGNRIVDQYGEWYSRCEYIIAMRFHACIFGYLLGVPTIALASHEQLLGLYQELKFEKFLVKLDALFLSKMKQVIPYTIENYESERERSIINIQEQIENYKKKIVDFLEDMGVL